VTSEDSAAAQLKERVLRERGFWSPFHEGLLRLDPAWLETYLDLVSGPWKTGLIAPKVRELIYVAIDASVTHLYERGIARHAAFALGHGATVAEIFEVLQITAGLTTRTFELGVPLLQAELRRLGRTAELGEDDRADPLPWLAPLRRHAPEFAAALERLAAAPQPTAGLDPRTRAFIGLAVCASPSTAWTPGIQRHIREALESGATGPEILDVLQLAAGNGIHTLSVGVPALLSAVDGLSPSR